MTDKDKERERIILKTADALRTTIKTEGWQYLRDYLMIRISGLKNELVKTNLGSDLSKAARAQGKIEGYYQIFNKIENAIKEAEIIRKRKKEEKKEK